MRKGKRDKGERDSRSVLLVSRILNMPLKEFFDFKRQKLTRLSSERDSRDVFHTQRRLIQPEDSLQPRLRMRADQDVAFTSQRLFLCCSKGPLLSLGVVNIHIHLAHMRRVRQVNMSES